MVIQHNILAMNGQRMLNINTLDQKKSAEKLASGYRVNRAADDAAGLAISEKMRRQIRGLTQASFNAQDGISLVQTAEGALNEVHDMLQRMNELSVKAANDTLTMDDRSYIQSEVKALRDEIDRTGSTTRFNEIKLLDGFRQTSATLVAPNVVGVRNASVTQATEDTNASYKIDPIQDEDVIGVENYYGDMVYYKVSSDENDNDGTSADKPISATKGEIYEEIASALLRANISQTGSAGCSYTVNEDSPDIGNYTVSFHGPLTLTLQVGSEAGDEMDIQINPINAGYLGLYDINVADKTGAGAKNAINIVKKAIEKVSTERSNLGAYQNRIEHTIKNLNNVVENTTDAESKIRDTDMAEESVANANRNILIQAGQTILSQANQTSSGVLSLLS